jgi:hypothetical protein
MAVRRVFPPELLPSLVDELDDMRVDETLGDLILLELCESAWPTRSAQDS